MTQQKGEKVINIARDFSKYPAGRNRDDGPFTGEHFRENILIPTLKDHSHITIELDGTRGYGSSFLEEAFGGLARKGMSLDTIRNKISIVSGDKSLVREIWQYVEEAATQHTPG